MSGPSTPCSGKKVFHVHFRSCALPSVWPQVLSLVEFGIFTSSTAGNAFLSNFGVVSCYVAGFVSLAFPVPLAARALVPNLVFSVHEQLESFQIFVSSVGEVFLLLNGWIRFGVDSSLMACKGLRSNLLFSVPK